MRRALPWILTGLGVVLVVTGIGVFAAANSGAADVGWSAYTPLQATEGPLQNAAAFGTAEGRVLWTTGHLLGAGLAVVGALLLAGVGGWLLGRRAGRRGSGPA